MSLIPKGYLDKHFYLICNPDVLKSNIRPEKHFLQHKNKEDRIYQKRSCVKRKIDPKTDYFDKLCMVLHKNTIPIKRNKKIIYYDLPWHLGSYGYPSRVYEIIILPPKNFQTFIINEEVVALVFKKFFRRKLYFIINDK